MIKRKRVERHARAMFNEGFFNYMGGGYSRTYPWTTTGAPRWHDPVARVAYPAGVDHAKAAVDELIADRQETGKRLRRRIGTTLKMEISPEVMAQVYAAAGISRIR